MARNGIVRSEKKEAFVLAQQFDVFLLNLDGVFCLGERPLPHAVDSVARLRNWNRALRFLTNNPRPTREEIVRWLGKMGIELRTEEVITSGWAIAEYLRRSGVRTAYVVGSPRHACEIDAAGIEIVYCVSSPGAVVVGCDESVTYHHIRRAAASISGGAWFVATNPDGSFPAPEGPLPVTGAIFEAVVASTGKRPTVAGNSTPHIRRGVDGAGHRRRADRRGR